MKDRVASKDGVPVQPNDERWKTGVKRAPTKDLGLQNRTPKAPRETAPRIGVFAPVEQSDELR